VASLLQHPHPYKQPMGGGEFDAMHEWAEDHHKWEARRASWDEKQAKDDWDSARWGHWRVEPGPEPSSLPYRLEPYGRKAYARYLGEHEKWRDKIYSWTRQVRKDPVPPPSTLNPSPQPSPHHPSTLDPNPHGRGRRGKIR
jgi:hypothetical protein